MSAAIDPAALRTAMLAASASVREARPRLTELDAVAGDGDLGESLAIGFRAVDEALAGLSEPESIGAVLMATGRALSTAAPSTFGTLLGLGLVDAGRATKETTALDAAAVLTVLRAIADGVARRGEVVAGQRTVLDGILASISAATEAAPGDVQATLAAAAEGAIQGAEATAAMSPQVGRAGWIGERAQGHPDAGAEAWSAFVGGLRRGVSDPS